MNNFFFFKNIVYLLGSLKPLFNYQSNIMVMKLGKYFKKKISIIHSIQVPMFLEHVREKSIFFRKNHSLSL